jgi:hypothetical protein
MKNVIARAKLEAIYKKRHAEGAAPWHLPLKNNNVDSTPADAGSERRKE